MENKKSVLTYEGLKKLEEELEILKTVKRKEVAEKIKEAIGQGDLSENAEYDSAKEEQAGIEKKIIELEKLLRNAEIIDEKDISTDVVSVGSKVSVKDLDNNVKLQFSIVGSAEADPMQGTISNESPVGKGLIGLKKGEKVEIDTPGGKSNYKILNIE